jgi:PilZ domain
MGRRSQPRMQIEVPVRIFGTDTQGQVFSEKVNTVTVSRLGAELSGVRAQLALDEIIGITYGSNRVHFRVKWIGAAGSARSGHIGLLNIAPEKPLWDFPLPSDAADNYQLGSIEQRVDARYRCQNSIEVHIPGGASLRGTIADLSLGGCYVEIPLQSQPGTEVKIGVWVGQAKIQATALVAHCTPGVGAGLKFIEISQQDRDVIRKFLDSLALFARKPLRAPQKI